jgi:hypothetical protein
VVTDPAKNALRCVGHKALRSRLGIYRISAVRALQGSGPQSAGLRVRRLRRAPVYIVTEIFSQTTCWCQEKQL